MTLKFIACCEYIKAKRQLLREPAIRKCGRNTRYGHTAGACQRRQPGTLIVTTGLRQPDLMPQSQDPTHCRHCDHPTGSLKAALEVIQNLVSAYPPYETDSEYWTVVSKAGREATNVVFIGDSLETVSA